MRYILQSGNRTWSGEACEFFGLLSLSYARQIGVQMEQTEIAEIAIDDTGKLNVTPRLPPGRTLELIYRAAMGVRWNADRQCLLPVEVISWNHVQWFGQIVAAVADEYGMRLILAASTRWRDVPAEVRTRIEDSLTDGSA